MKRNGPGVLLKDDEFRCYLFMYLTLVTLVTVSLAAYGFSPFGYLRINGYVLLPAAFRSLSRPSSAPDAKAFALCSFRLTCLCFRSLSITSTLQHI